MQTGASVTEFFQMLGRPVAYFPIFASKLGGVTPAVMFCQLSHWYRIEAIREWDGWIYKTTQDMYDETGLTRWEQETARKRLVSVGVIETKVKGIPPKMNYRIRWETFESLWGNPSNQFVGKPQINEMESTKSSIQREQHKTTTLDASFESFWSVYPRKAEKKRALKCYQTARKQGATDADLLTSATNYARHVVKARTEVQFIKLPGTFLGPNEPWRDWVTAKVEKVETTAKAAVRGWTCPKGHLNTHTGAMCTHPECEKEMMGL
jgi:hypothetical protein